MESWFFYAAKERKRCLNLPLSIFQVHHQALDKSLVEDVVPCRLYMMMEVDIGSDPWHPLLWRLGTVGCDH